ncbi:MAG: DNRLRE domain-containing protein [Vicinamibacterales bacterium]
MAARRSASARAVRAIAVTGLLTASLLQSWAPVAAAGPTRTVTAPNLTGVPFAPAIFWFGKVDMSANYADVRVWYYEPYLKVVVHVTDRVLWHDPNPDPTRLTAWDAVSLYLDIAGSTGATTATSSHRFDKQLWGGDAATQKAAFRGNGTGWAPAATPFTTADSWRGNGPNDDVWDAGWEAEFLIPFASLGLTGPPATGTTWGLALALHDRDDAAGTPIADQVWPESMIPTRPESWGQLRFGRETYSPPPTTIAGTTVVRQGLSGAVVADAAVGGHTICGGSLNEWTEWGAANYAGYAQFNVQNQWDVSDFTCFSKYYVTFPLAAVPPTRTIVSAKVSLTLFGNAGFTPTDAKPSSVNVMTVATDWDERTITWNTAPYASEDVSTTWVHPVSAEHPAGPYEWDVSLAVAKAYAAGQPLRLVFYSTDGDYHSGKYFWSSDADAGLATSRPTLQVTWGVPAAAPTAPTGVRVRVP